MFGGVYAGRRVLVTGHTGFKGSWLAQWLIDLGAEVAGFSLGTVGDPSAFEVLGLEGPVRHYVGDVRDRGRLGEVFDDFRPEFVLHLAAQSLVRRSYAEPATTFETNAMGTLNVLECVRERPSVAVVVLITSDKSYRNVEWTWGYRESDVLGGEDPYSGSKGCAELIAYSYYHSFFKDSSTRIATTRAGNVIGGGDWALDRIVPDSMRAWSKGSPVTVRNPSATRPWQHVLEPLSGYLWLGAKLWTQDKHVVGESYNFGPNPNVDRTVGQLLDAMSGRWPGARWQVSDEGDRNEREATLLKLCCDKALYYLNWRAVLELPETLEFTVDWYRAYYEDGSGMPELTSAQIERYSSLAHERGLAWAAA